MSGVAESSAGGDGTNNPDEHHHTTPSASASSSTATSLGATTSSADVLDGASLASSAAAAAGSSGGVKEDTMDMDVDVEIEPMPKSDDTEPDPDLSTGGAAAKRDEKETTPSLERALKEEDEEMSVQKDPEEVGEGGESGEGGGDIGMEGDVGGMGHEGKRVKVSYHPLRSRGAMLADELGWTQWRGEGADVKVYELRESSWFDRGTGYCKGVYDEVQELALLIVEKEDEEAKADPSVEAEGPGGFLKDDLLLSSRVEKDDIYTRQQGKSTIPTTISGASSKGVCYKELYGRTRRTATAISRGKSS